jgi:hypothetical protein
MVAVLQDGVFHGYVSVEDAEGFFVSMPWLEMLYRLADGRWVHVHEEPPEQAETAPGRLMTESLCRWTARKEVQHDH